MDEHIRLWVYVKGGINTIKPAFLDSSGGANSSNVYLLGGVLPVRVRR